MNEKQLVLLDFLNLGRIVSDALDYCLGVPGASYDVKKHQDKAKAYKELIAPGKIFAINCEKNGEAGEQLRDLVNDFYDDVFEEEGRIVRTNLITNKIEVEQSLIYDLYSEIVQLRIALESFLKSGIKNLGEDIDEDFSSLIFDDIFLYHAKAAKCGTILLIKKFNERANLIRSILEDYARKNGGRRATDDPSFNINDDSSFRMATGEVNDILKCLMTVTHFPEADTKFKHQTTLLYDDLNFFVGKKHPSDINLFFNMLQSYYNELIQEYDRKLMFEGAKVNSEIFKLREEKKKEMSAASEPETSKENN